MLYGLLFCALFSVRVKTRLLINRLDSLKCASVSHWSTCLHLRRKHYGFYRASKSSHVKKVKGITLNAGRNATCLQFPCRPWIIRACRPRKRLLFIWGGDSCMRLLADCSFWPWKRSVILICKTRYRIFSLSPPSDILIYHISKLISFWTIRYPPRLRPRLVETANVLINVCRRAISGVFWISPLNIWCAYSVLIYFLFWCAYLTFCSNLANPTPTGNMCFNCPARPFNSCQSIWFSLTDLPTLDTGW